MVDNIEEKSSILKDLLKILAQALIPVVLTLPLAFATNYFFPQNEIRFIPSQFDSKTIYVSIENHRSDFLGPLIFSVFKAPGLKVIGQNDYLNTDIKEGGTDFFMLTLSQILPSQRTTLILHADQPIGAANFEFLSGSTNTKIVPSQGLQSNNLPRSSWVNFVFQFIIYFVFFAFLNFYLKKIQSHSAQTAVKLEEAKSNTDALRGEYQARAEEIEKKIRAVRNAAAKDRILTRRLYDQIDRENRFWRLIFLKSLDKMIGGGRMTSLDILRSVARVAGFKRTERITDPNIELLLSAIESNNEIDNEISQEKSRARINPREQ